MKINSNFLFLFLFLFLFNFCFSLNVEVEIYQTSQYTQDRITKKTSIYFQPIDSNLGDTQLILEPNITHQTIQGFGGSFTESSAINLFSLSTSVQQQIMESLFQYLNFSMGRIHINSCDYCESTYNFDDISGDYNLTKFNLSNGPDLQTIIPMIKMALNYNPNLKIVGSPWSPPPQYKSNNEMNTSSIPCLIDNITISESWALYFSKFIQAYKDEGVDIWGVTVQNQPTQNNTWESCVYSAYQEADFLINHLGPRLRQDFPDVKIFIHDGNKDTIFDWASLILSETEVFKYCDGVAFQWYSGFDFGDVAKVSEYYPEYMLLSTEAGSCPMILNDWGAAEFLAFDMIGDLNSNSVGWIAWNLILDMEGGPNHAGNNCTAIYHVDTIAKRVYVQPQFYYIGQLTKFIWVNSTRIEVNNQGIYTLNLDQVAFQRTDNKIILVVMTSVDYEIDFDIVYGNYYAKTTISPRTIMTFLFDKF
ncbi:glucosylceramidase [Anaeramoeba ignava]|uniref:Glucosylceramidase n=1 Tax=Anaeramoeba ignava TaxID=1746090 RepID=A0A9Q0RGK3_ANAIG|nr:glucosylceramidase [Anaeramoeba ignava]